jgi:O-6-methylguanine DNA methyltransferase
MYLTGASTRLSEKKAGLLQHVRAVSTRPHGIRVHLHAQFMQQSRAMTTLSPSSRQSERQPTDARIVVPTTLGTVQIALAAPRTGELFDQITRVTFVQAVAATSTTDIAHASREVARVVDQLPRWMSDPTVELASFDTIDIWLENASLPPFQLAALRALARVPAGETVTYGELAHRAGHPSAARAAGSACASNPLMLIVPCHRVVPASGGLGDFARGAYGPTMKRDLLARELAI